MAAEATMAWSIAWSEHGSTEGTRNFLDAGVEMNRMPDEDLERVQGITNEVILRGACEDPMHARVYHSQISYLEDYAVWRDASAPFNMSRVMDNLPALEEIEECM